MSWLEGGGLGLARNSVQQYALKTGSEQAFGIDKKIADHCVDRPDNAAFDIARRPSKLDLLGRLKPTYWLAYLRHYMVSYYKN